ncbi:hypothetical protein BDZ97DRAFT_1801845 [Flammula alnicola]|nr:hypothetical protein BDZ97DRAFT_1801845 [Flammula alnicola]
MSFGMPVEIARGAACIAAMLNACELLTHFPEEMEYIWMVLREFTLMKGLYLFARYYIFVVHLQVFLYGDVLQYVSSSDRLSPSMRTWWLYKAFMLQAFVWVIHSALMKRIYLLFNRKRWMFNFLLCLSTVRLAIAATVIVSIYQTKTEKPSTTGTIPIIIVANYLAGEILLQSVISILAVGHGSTSRTPLATRLMENGVESLITVAFMTMSLTTYTFVHGASAFMYS